MNAEIDHPSAGVTPPRPPAQRWTLAAAAVLVLTLGTSVLTWVRQSRAVGTSLARPLPLYPAATCTSDLGPDLTAYTTPDPFASVVRHYRQGLAGARTGTSSCAYAFVGEVERVQVVPTPPDRNADQALFLHRFNHMTTWTFLAAARNGKSTRILTGRLPDWLPPTSYMGAKASFLNDWWRAPWGSSGGVAVQGGMVAGTASVAEPFEAVWPNRAGLVGCYVSYRPGLNSAKDVPSTLNGAARPGVYWTGDETDGLRIAAFERFDRNDGYLEFLSALPGDKKTRLFLARLLN